MQIDGLKTVFPKTRYYGSKRKHLDWIFNNVKCLEFNTVLDVFGGSGSVSLLFSSMGKDVTYNDCFVFNSICADAVLNRNSYDEINNSIKYVENINSMEGFVFETFKGVYFQDDENKFIDGFVEYIKNVDGREKTLLYYAFFQSCLSKRPYNLFHRANLSLRTNEAKRTFGNLTTWNKQFKVAMKEFIWELHRTESFKRSKIVCEDALDISSGYDLVYLDPPYVSAHRHTESYATRYHFLEGIASPELWEDRIDFGTKTKKFKNSVFESEWSSKSKNKELMFKLVEKHCESIVVLSYGDDAVPSVDEILGFMKTKFSCVELHYKYHKHSLSKRDRNEAIFIGIP